MTDDNKEQVIQKADGHAKSVVSKTKGYTPT